MLITSVTFVVLSIITSVTLPRITFNVHKTTNYLISLNILIYFILIFEMEDFGFNFTPGYKTIYRKQAHFVMDVMLCHGRDGTTIC